MREYEEANASFVEQALDRRPDTEIVEFSFESRDLPIDIMHVLSSRKNEVQPALWIQALAQYVSAIKFKGRAKRESPIG